ncbi:hypothetical protein L1987_84750 [Smallanthus sonchifolius]|uniref:Uncharacterized protein n=1 Tax=Smallanthus sonchifolius TaxID=185202 RepID=A0ACB8XUL7_9ASTR|nr:hypothetical protein L1987_84750 [Smallanthus sonchifolius]
MQRSFLICLLIPSLHFPHNSKPFSLYRILSAIMRNMKKSPKVADESMFGEGNRLEFPNIAQHTRQGFSAHLALIYNIIRAPLSLLSCLSSEPSISGATDGVWVSGELARMSEVNHLMVNDSMRYVILM